MLSDFGLARLRFSSSHTSTQARGTPSYMAPEQWRGEAVPASDQYSLAIMAYRLLTGRYPFVGDSVNVLYQHINTPPPDASQMNARVPIQLATVLQLAMAKQSSERFPTIATFAQAFEQAARSAPIELGDSLVSQPLDEEPSPTSGSWYMGSISEPSARSTSHLSHGRRTPITIGDLPAIAPEILEDSTTPPSMYCPTRSLFLACITRQQNLPQAMYPLRVCLHLRVRATRGGGVSACSSC
ncbi:hypothetical protein KSX_63100 [Ktedonospora formicarum]|uniref:Protein kinase domain-containing protein n=2 Tax=Ktedonospora formicarum TaxID=2778364 RepID=A0A8J3MTE2_9CHLR|nr:hypothetical protein KSX_63100 [Ktedonospora formicarum]